MNRVGLAAWVIALAAACLVGPANGVCATHVIAALGDSITAATFADIAGPRGASGEDPRTGRAVLQNKKSLSWATGTRIASHAERFRHFLEARYPDDDELEVRNLAKLGATTQSLLGQVDRLVDEMSSDSDLALDYVTITIGSNDACDKSGSGTPVATMRQRLALVFQKLSSIRQQGPLHVLVSSIPPIPELGRPEIQSARNRFGISCRTMHRFFRYCPSLTEWHTEEQRLAASAIVTEKNEALRAAVDEASALPGLLIFFSESVARAPVEPDLLAIDCFHPSRAGQELLAETLWQDQPWFR